MFDMLMQIVKVVGEMMIIVWVGGVLMLVVGMVYILYQVIGGEVMMVFWYYFVILFEVLFILMVVDVGMCVGCFMLQDLFGMFYLVFKCIELLLVNFVVIVLCVVVWGYFLYQGVVDLFGGINMLWLLFGILNQMFVVIVLVFGIVVLFKMKCECYVWVMIVLIVWLLICMLMVGWQKIFDVNLKVSFFVYVVKLQVVVDEGKVFVLVKLIVQMKWIIFNDYIDVVLVGLFIFVVVVIVVYGVIVVLCVCCELKLIVCEMLYEVMLVVQVFGSGC